MIEEGMEVYSRSVGKAKIEFREMRTLYYATGLHLLLLDSPSAMDIDS